MRPHALGSSRVFSSPEIKYQFADLMDSDDLYDEFGNYIGNSDESNTFDENDDSIKAEPQGSYPGEDDEASGADLPLQQAESKALLLHDERNTDVETVVVEPSHTGNDEPVIKPTIEKNLYQEYKVAENSDEASLPRTTYSKQYLSDLFNTVPERIRNVAVVGNFHCGKSSLIDMLVMSTHPDIKETKREFQEAKPLRYSDTHVLEQSRGLSAFSNALTLLLSDLKGRSHITTLLDCPGHPDFQEETELLLRAADGAILVLDAVEGFTKRDRRILTNIIKKNLPVVLVLHKFDRLILESRIPVEDCFAKIKFILNEVNACIHHNEFIQNYSCEKLLSPLLGNVVFSSYTFKSTFSLQSFSSLYMERCTGLDHMEFSKFEKLLWGDIFFDNQTGKFSRDPKKGVRTFEHFILEPLYKLVSYTITADSANAPLRKILYDEFGVSLDKDFFKNDPQVLLRRVFSSVLGDVSGLVDLVCKFVPPPEDKQSETLQAEILKKHDSLCSLTKVALGTLESGSSVKVYQDNEEPKDLIIQALYIPCGQYKIPVSKIQEGRIGLVEWKNSYILKPALIVDVNRSKSKMDSFHYNKIGQQSHYKIAVEPENPKDLPEMVSRLKNLSATYLSAVVKLEESGEHVVLAPGELFLDFFLHDLREGFPEYLSIKVSDPMVRFSETCGESSAIKIATQSMTKKSHISITAEPLNEKSLSKAIETGHVNLDQPERVTAKLLRTQFGWDALAARSLWSFGPADLQRPSLLLDDSLEDETNKSSLLSAKEAIISGFKIGLSEGPLCEEAIRNTKFKILDAVLNGNEVTKSTAQFIPVTRNAVHTGLLTAAPRLMEPTYRAHIVCTRRAIEAIQIIMDKRRGWTFSENPIPATQLYEIEGYVPIIESIGLETDMRVQTQGQAMCLLEFSKWDVVPGDPLDSQCALPTLKPVPRSSMARDFVMKTRRRKGLSGEPSLQKYIDGELYSRLVKSGFAS